ncbi:hypothetical protein [Oryzibacter oryziterrae]|uniref:hypothetical protein n=1 Tax=Oryzibacter oryziterrae TaxID=2766474 RepID=UPI001F1E0DFF|nr:hypothetical protein [Oryzibacter oryziterrae]
MLKYSALLGTFALALAAGASMPASAATKIISLSGPSFVRHCPCTSSTVENVENGMLVPTDEQTFYANVDFPVDGEKICSVSMYYEDLNANDSLKVTLKRKAIVSTSAETAPSVLATLTSQSGVTTNMRKVTTTAISKPLIDEAKGFYYVEAKAITTNLNLVGVQITTGPTCK